MCERVIRTVRNLLEKPIILAGNADWLSELQSVIKQFTNTIQHRIKETQVQASKKLNEKLVHTNLKENRKIQKPNFQPG